MAVGRRWKLKTVTRSALHRVGRRDYAKGSIMTATIDYIMATGTDVRYMGNAIERGAADVVYRAFKHNGTSAEGVVGCIGMQFTDRDGVRRNMPGEVYRMCLTRVNGVIEVAITSVPLMTEDVTRYTVACFEWPTDPDTGLPTASDSRRREWMDTVLAPRVRAMVDAVWGEWAEAAHAAERRFGTPKTAAGWLETVVYNAAMWAAWQYAIETTPKR